MPSSNLLLAKWENNNLAFSSYVDLDILAVVKGKLTYP